MVGTKRPKINKWSGITLWCLMDDPCNKVQPLSAYQYDSVMNIRQRSLQDSAMVDLTGKVTHSIPLRTHLVQFPVKQGGGRSHLMQALVIPQNSNKTDFSHQVTYFSPEALAVFAGCYPAVSTLCVEHTRIPRWSPLRLLSCHIILVYGLGRRK